MRGGGGKEGEGTVVLVVEFKVMEEGWERGFGEERENDEDRWIDIGLTTASTMKTMKVRGWSVEWSTR